METCRILNSIASPKLYEHLVLRVPMDWSQMPSLESLLSSSGENFSLIRHITITSHHVMLKKNKKVPEHSHGVLDVGGEDMANYPTTDSEDSEEDWFHLVDHQRLFMVPPPWVSKVLNVLLRLLVARIPKHQLQTFRYVWPSLIL